MVDEDHRGGANFARGGLGRPVHGTVAGFRDGEAAGEFSSRDRVGKVVCRERGSVAELLALFNWTEGRQGSLDGAGHDVQLDADAVLALLLAALDKGAADVIRGNQIHQSLIHNDFASRHTESVHLIILNQIEFP